MRVMSTTQEETNPLIPFMMDDGTTRGQRIQIERGGYRGITSEAETVIAEWPSKYYQV